MATTTIPAPETYEDAAARLAAATAAGRAVGFVGAGTKLGWGRAGTPADEQLSTTSLAAILEHNAGDMTATLQAGVPLATAQRTFAAAGQMLALDPPLSAAGRAGAATIGGVVATSDSGPLRHRYGLPRDLVVGITVALADGTIARAGGKVIKNVAGYDLAKLFSGSFGTLGLILEVNVRLHPLHELSATALGATTDPDRLAAAARALSAAPLEFEALDVAWRAGRGGLLARSAGAQAVRRARRAARLMTEAGLEEVDVAEADGPLWERQRAGQRAEDQAVLRVAGAPGALAGLIRALDAVEATLVGRAAVGTHYVALEPDAVAELRRALGANVRATLLDAPPRLREPDDLWGSGPAAPLELMRRIKARFDPTATCNPGLFVGGI
jgi:glycolate oxidase FAD binding subunit